MNSKLAANVAVAVGDTFNPHTSGRHLGSRASWLPRPFFASHPWFVMWQKFQMLCSLFAVFVTPAR